MRDFGSSETFFNVLPTAPYARKMCFASIKGGIRSFKRKFTVDWSVNLLFLAFDPHTACSIAYCFPFVRGEAIF
jgi:hypothetical protein